MNMTTEQNFKNKRIYIRDNMDILPFINSECIDLIYADPPFQSNPQSVSPIKTPNSKAAIAAAEAAGVAGKTSHFKDMFGEDDLKQEWLDAIKYDHPKLNAILDAIQATGRGSSTRTFVDADNNKTRVQISDFGYLAYMAIRLIECHRVLKKTGSIYLHCDPTMSHSLKLVMDCIFGEKNFRNEIVWYYYNKYGAGKRVFGRNYDQILFYSKGENYKFNAPREQRKHPVKQLVRQNVDGVLKNKKDADGKLIYRIVTDKKVDAVWQIPCLQYASNEYVGYSTQKPRALLERIIKASSNVGETVLDPFCGCTTACVSAEKLNRRWIGIDTAELAYGMVKYRLANEGIQPKMDEDMNYEGRDEVVRKLTASPKRTDGGVPSQDELRYVYVFAADDTPDEYKVGIAKAPQRRLNELQTGRSRRNLKLVHSRKTRYYREIEKASHIRFRAVREWTRKGTLEEIKRFIDDWKPSSPPKKT